LGGANWFFETNPKPLKDKEGKEVQSQGRGRPLLKRKNMVSRMNARLLKRGNSVRMNKAVNVGRDHRSAACKIGKTMYKEIER